MIGINMKGLMVQVKNLKTILEGDYNEHYANYLVCCESLDYNLGRIRSKLKDLGIEDNTIIIYTSDHGCNFKTRNKALPPGGADYYKRSFYENTIKVPLIVYGPKFKVGKIINELVSLIDIPKTIAEIPTGKTYDKMRGISLDDMVNGNLKREDIFIQISESYVGRAIRTKKYKYCIIDETKKPYIESSSNVYRECYLYDLENDKLEQNNLINDLNYENVRRSMRKIIKGYIKDIENIDIKIID
jgi:arylsulfatase A-like enzyme